MIAIYQAPSSRIARDRGVREAELNKLALRWVEIDGLGVKFVIGRPEMASRSTTKAEKWQ